MKQKEMKRTYNTILMIAIMMILIVINSMIAGGRPTVDPNQKLADEEIYNQVLQGNYLVSDSQKQQLVNYLNSNPLQQKAFFEKKGILFESSGVTITSYTSGMNNGEEINIRLKNSNSVFEIDLENKKVITKESTYEFPSRDNTEININDNYISLKGTEVNEKNTDGTIKSKYSGEVKIFPDGRKELAKETSFTNFKDDKEDISYSVEEDTELLTSDLSPTKGKPYIKEGKILEIGNLNSELTIKRGDSVITLTPDGELRLGGGKNFEGFPEIKQKLNDGRTIEIKPTPKGTAFTVCDGETCKIVGSSFTEDSSQSTLAKTYGAWEQKYVKGFKQGSKPGYFKAQDGGNYVEYPTFERINELTKGKAVKMVVTAPSWCGPCRARLQRNPNEIAITITQAKAIGWVGRSVPSEVIVKDGKVVR
ncbi:hypothetical protein J4221_05895 [Candidatus Pacearchaeota archaeon]|nr:hypothetical protein [Candidatus Pacearchaeota archaeon]